MSTRKRGNKGGGRSNGSVTSESATTNRFDALGDINEDADVSMEAKAALLNRNAASNLMANTGSSTTSTSAPAMRAPSPSSIAASSLMAITGSSMASTSAPATTSATKRSYANAAASLAAATASSLTASAPTRSTMSSGMSAPGGGSAYARVQLYLKPNFDHKYPPPTDFDESLVLSVEYPVAGGGRRKRSLTRYMMAPDESRVLTVVANLDPATNGVRTKPMAERGVMQGDTVYRNFLVSQDLVMANTAVNSVHNEVIGVAMVTQGEHVEGDPISYAVAFAGSTSLIFRGFKLTDETMYTAEPGHRFGLDFSCAAEETGRVDGLKRHVNVHRRARGATGFISSYFTALSPGVPGHKIHSIIDY